MPLEVLIRTVTEADKSEVLAVVRDAFSVGNADGREEVEIVESIWSLDCQVPAGDLVALSGGEIVGHILASLGSLSGVVIPGIAPLSVRSDCQRQGVGSALMATALRHLEVQQFPFVVLLGNPTYYGRFGFRASGPWGIHYLPVGMNNPHFQLLQFDEDCEVLTGEYVYSWEVQANAQP